MSSASAVKSVPIATLITDACAKLLGNQTSLPSMAAVAARIHDAMASPNWSMRTIATIIKSDLGTTTYLLQVANSPLYAGAGPARQVEQAIAPWHQQHAPPRDGACGALDVRDTLALADVADATDLGV